MKDSQLKTNVAAELTQDPETLGCGIHVSEKHGAVTLHGMVRSIRQKRECLAAARRIDGVASVTDQLDVRVAPEGRREDATVCDAVRQALALDRAVPSSVEATVQDGRVTLTGTAAWQYERAEAEFVCANVDGVLDIEDQVTLTPAVGHDDLQAAIRSALARRACLAIRALSVDARIDGTVILSGAVTTWHEHDEALAVAWSTAGVTDVDDRILIAY